MPTEVVIVSGSAGLGPSTPGSAIIGRVGIDQTTPGTSNLVSIGAGAVAQGALTDRSGTITAGGTANTNIAANAARRYFLLQNLSNTVLWVNFGVTAVQDQPSIALKACGAAGDGTGGAIVFEGSFVPTGTVSIIGPTTGSKFACKEG